MSDPARLTMMLRSASQRRPALADRHAAEAVQHDHRRLAEDLEREAVPELVHEDRDEACRPPR